MKIPLSLEGFGGKLFKLQEATIRIPVMRAHSVPCEY